MLTPRVVLVDVQFWWLEALFAALVALTALNARAMIQWMRVRIDIRALAAWTLVGILLAAFVAPRIPRMFYDEQIYQHVGQNLADLRKAQFCNEGVAEYGRLQCIRGEYNKEPYVWPHLLSVAYRLVGVHEWIAHVVNNIAVGALVWAVALIALSLFDDARAALAAAAVAALVPQLLRWGNTGAAEPIASAASAWAVAASAWFTRTRTSSALGWAAVLTAFAVQVRPESVLVAPIVAGVIVLFARDELNRRRTWWWAVAALLVCAMFIAHLIVIRNETWQATGARFAIEHVRQNLPTNASFFVADERFPVIYTVLALIGLAVVDRRAALVIGAWVLFFWGVFVAFYAGSYDWGANVRYSVMLSAPIALLAGAGVRWFSERTVARRLSRPLWLLLAAIVFQFLWYMPQVRDIGEESWAARADVRFAREFAASVPPDSMILTQNPNMFLLWGRNAAQLSLVTTDEPYVRAQMFPRYGGGVYVHWNFWCNIADKVQHEFCVNAITRFSAEVVQERRERDYRFILYRLSP